MTISAAPPWIGVLIALLNPIPNKLPFTEFTLKNLSNFLYLPNNVWVTFYFFAIYCFSFCHFYTYGRSLNQAFITFLAYSTVQFQS